MSIGIKNHQTTGHDITTRLFKKKLLLESSHYRCNKKGIES